MTNIWFEVAIACACGHIIITISVQLKLTTVYYTLASSVAVKCVYIESVIIPC